MCGYQPHGDRRKPPWVSTPNTHPGQLNIPLFKWNVASVTQARDCMKHFREHSPRTRNYWADVTVMVCNSLYNKNVLEPLILNRWRKWLVWSTSAIMLTCFCQWLLWTATGLENSNWKTNPAYKLHTTGSNSAAAALNKARKEGTSLWHCTCSNSLLIGLSR